MVESLVALRRWRAERKLRIKEIARQMGYTRPYISNIFLGAKEISDGFIGCFVRTYGFDVARQVFGARDTPPAETGETPA